MYRHIDIEGFLVKVNIKKHAVHISANYALLAAMKDSLLNIENLCTVVLAEHKKTYNKELEITVNSFVMEVLGHAFAYKVLKRLRKIADWKIFRKLSYNACAIDCGNQPHDANRWFWDMAGILKPMFFLFVRKKAKA